MLSIVQVTDQQDAAKLKDLSALTRASNVAVVS